MKFLLAAVCVSMVFLAGAPARADGDDAKWVARCLKDNAEAKVPTEVVAKYCTCMNNKMDDNETKTISQWEKTHPAEMKACETEAGWK